MKKNIWWLMVVIVFVAGLLVSNMLVQAKENVIEIQWEYKTVKVHYKNTRGEKSERWISSNDLSILNKHGKDGWELSGTNKFYYYLKREIRE